MGIKAGLDFGTTTSIFSYLERPGEQPKPFKYGGESSDQGRYYVPTVVAYGQQAISIGQFALDTLPDEVSSYRYFKMLLPEADAKKWDQHGAYSQEQRTPEQVAADFIGELINGASPGRTRVSAPPDSLSFKETHGHEIEGLVVSVPHVWNEVLARGRTELQRVIKDELKLPLLQLISEPVAAAAFFAHRYQMRHEEAYRGTLLICDMGGGTFDVTLCRLAPHRVEVLCNAGNGERGLGIAGAHFDRNLIDLRLREEKFEASAEVYDELLNDLNKEKQLKNSLTLLTRCMQNPDEPQFRPIYTIKSSVRAFPCRYEHLVTAFDEVHRGIIEVLGKVRQQAEALGEEIDRVALVGGFSKFPLVQQTIGEFFGERIFDAASKRRMIDLDTLSPDDMAFAISYGACLIANGVVEVSEKYEHTIGIEVTNTKGERMQIELVRPSDSLDALFTTDYVRDEQGQERRFKISSGTIRPKLLIRLFGERELVRQVELKNIPNHHLSENRWLLGTRVDHSKVPYLVIRDEMHGREEHYPLVDLIPEIILED